MKKINIGILYLSLHNLLKKKYGINNIFPRKKMYCELGKHFIVPKNIRVCVIKELENFNLIRREDRDNIKLLDCEVDLEKDANLFYEQLKLY
jgi:hypothetical protein